MNTLDCKQEIILIGGGGHARACIDVIEQEGKYKICGIIDSFALENGAIDVLGYPIIGGEELLERLDIRNAFIAVGQIETYIHRLRIYNVLKSLNYSLPTIISPLAYIAKGVKILEGSIIMHHALINSNATIGKACIINSKALVEHDSMVGDFCHLSTGSVVNGGCHIGEGSFLGSNMILRHKSTIKPRSLLYSNPLESKLNIYGGGGGNPYFLYSHFSYPYFIFLFALCNLQILLFYYLALLCIANPIFPRILALSISPQRSKNDTTK